MELNIMKKLFRLILVIALGCTLVACQTKTDEKSGQQQINEEQTNEEQTNEEQTNDSPVTTSIPQNSEIAKINGAADEVGIYSIVVKLTNQAADKGVIEMVYYGAKGSPQEDSIVNTFRIEYYKEDAGTFEIQTFYDGEIYQNQHHKNEVKVVNTFSASLRAGNVIISYTPDGEETQEIFRADAEYFFASEN